MIAGIVRAGEGKDIDVIGDMINSVGDAWVIEKKGFAANETKTIFEPTLRFVLAELYDKIGLKTLANEEYREAEFLAKAKP